MKTNIAIVISPPISYLAKFWLSSYRGKCCHPNKLPNSLKCNISRKKWMIKFIFGMQTNIEFFYKLILSFWGCLTRNAQSTENEMFAFLCNISRKLWGMKFIFCLQINAKVFYKLTVSLWVWIARDPQKTQNKKSTLLHLECLMENLKDEVDFLPADKRQRFLQVDINLRVSLGMPKLPNTTSFLFLCNILRNKWVMKLIFCMHISKKAYYKLIL